MKLQNHILITKQAQILEKQTIHKSSPLTSFYRRSLPRLNVGQFCSNLKSHVLRAFLEWIKVDFKDKKEDSYQPQRQGRLFASCGTRNQAL